MTEAPAWIDDQIEFIRKLERHATSLSVNRRVDHEREQ